MNNPFLRKAHEFSTTLSGPVSPHTSSICDNLYRFYHNSRPLSDAKARACVQVGLVPVLIDLSNSTEIDVRQSALGALVQLCFQDTGACEEATNNTEGLRQVIHLAFLDASEEPRANHQAVALMSNLAAHYNESHPLLITFLPQVTPMMRPESRDSHCMLAVRFISHLARCKANHSKLLSPNVLAPLGEVMRSTILERGCTSATVAMAMLSNQQASPLGSLIEMTDTQRHNLSTLLFGALSAAVKHHDFPLGSNVFPTGWRYLIGVTELARDEHFKQEFLKLGTLNILSECLASNNDSHTNATGLRCLWVLSS